MIPLVTLIAAFVAGYCVRWLHEAIRGPAQRKAPTVVDLTHTRARSRRRSPRSTPR